MVKKKFKILIIGSNSFSAGSMIKLLLNKKYTVFGISRSKFNRKEFSQYNNNDKNFFFIKIDINKNFKKLMLIIKKIKPDFLINYASQSMVGQSWENSSDWFFTNSYSTIKLYDFLSKLTFKIKLIHISTPEVYGNLNNMVSENHNYFPTSPYSVSRVTAEQFLKILFEKFNFNYCSVRASNVFGPCQKLYRIIPKTIISILKKKKINLEGGGNSKRNFIFIDDVSEAIFKIMKDKKNSGEIFHISGDKLISIKNLVKLICKKMNYSHKDLIFNAKNRISQDKSYILSSKKIKNRYRWTCKTSLAEGLDICIDWVKNNLSNFRFNDEIYIHKK